jgi:hypothetical protein
MRMKKKKNVGLLQDIFFGGVESAIELHLF